MKGFMALLLLTAVFPVGAQNLYRCVDYQGGVSIQDAPCPPASRETKRVAIQAYEETASSRTARAAAHQQARAAHQSRSFQPARSTSGGRQPAASRPWYPDSANKACEDAKAYRQRMLEILGLRRTYDDLQRLDEGVYRACRR